MIGRRNASEAAVIRAVAALDEDQRRRLYAFARRARQPITREEAAAALGISRKLAAFHLDKLVEAGLLSYRFQSAGPTRVGRRPKVYEVGDTDIAVTIPQRRPDLLAEILVDALLTQPPPESGPVAARHVAHQQGLKLGADAQARLRTGRLGAERALTLVQEIVGDYGFEPERTQSHCVRLRNCPFHPLAQREPELVCGLNQALLSGLLEGLQASAIQAVLAPAPGECCVELRPAEPPS